MNFAYFSMKFTFTKKSDKKHDLLHYYIFLSYVAILQ